MLVVEDDGDVINHQPVEAVSNRHLAPRVAEVAVGQGAEGNRTSHPRAFSPRAARLSSAPSASIRPSAPSLMSRSSLPVADTVAAPRG